MNLAGLSLRDLEYLLAVSELRHFGRAAERCGVSQPGLSAQIAKLEELLGAPLFERSAKKVLVTPFGEQMAAHARSVVREARALLEAALHQGKGLSGPLTIGAIQTLGPYLFPHILKPLRARFPDLKLKLVEGRTEGLLEELREGRLDCVFLALPVADPRLVTERLFFEPFLLACPAGREIHPARLDRLPTEGLLLLEEGHCLRDQALSFCSADSGSEQHATGLETLRHMVAAGTGWSFLPALAAPGPDSMAGLVTHQRLAPSGKIGPAGREIAIAWRRSDPRDYQALAECLRKLDLPKKLRFAG